MGNRIGVIFHYDWEEFSPLFYSHFGAESIPFKLQKYLKDYDIQYKRCNTNGHLYNPEHMMLGFIQSLDKDIHMRIQNLNECNLEFLQNNHNYPNCFEGGCWKVNVSENNFGKTVCGGNYLLEHDNIVQDELEDFIRLKG